MSHNNHTWADLDPLYTWKDYSPMKFTVTLSNETPKPAKLPSLKKAVADYRKAVAAVPKTRKARDTLHDEFCKAERAHDDAVGAEIAARNILLQVAGK